LLLLVITMATFSDIPFEVFTSYILQYITVREVGFLAQVDTMWRDFASRSVVWKYLYLRLTPAVILDTSVHIGSKRERLRDRTREYHIFRHSGTATTVYHGRHPFIPVTTDRCLNSDWLLNHSWGCGCIPPELKSTLKSWRQVRQDGIQDDNFPRTQEFQNTYNTAHYCSYVNSEWKEYNRKRGLSTVNLCQNPDHYTIDSLGALDDCKNKRSFKKETIKILSKKPKAVLAKATREKKAKLIKLEKARRAIQQLELEYIEAEKKEKQESEKYENIKLGISLA